jgi:hypothetical protein
LEPNTVAPRADLSDSAAKIARDADVKVKELLPVFTIWFADVDSLLAVGKKIAGIIGVSGSEFDEKVNGVLSMVNGLNRTEPFGVIFRTNGNDFNDPLLVLPINDLSKFSVAALPLQVTKVEDGKFRIALPNFNVIAYQKNGYAVVVPETSNAPIPAKPKAYFADIEKYTIGFKVDLANTSHETITKLAAPFALLAAMRDPKAGEQFQQTIEQLKFYFDELKTVYYGIKVDPKTLDVDVTVSYEHAANSKVFSRVGEVYKNRKTIFSGFKTSKTPVFTIAQAGALPEGTDWQLPKELVQITVEQYDSLFKGFLKQIEEDTENEDVIKHAKAGVKSLNKLIAASLKLSEADYNITFDVEGTFLAASLVKETNTVEELFDSVLGFAKAKIAEEDDGAKYISLIQDNMKLEYDTASDYRLSKFTIPIDKIADLGEVPASSRIKAKNYTLFAAVKDKVAVAVAGGFDADKTETTLKAALKSTSSATKLTQSVFLFDLQALGQFLKQIGFENVDQDTPKAGVAKIIVDRFLGAGNKAKITVEDKFSGKTLSATMKVDGEVVGTIAKLAKQIYEKTVASQDDEEEDTANVNK